MVFLKKLICTFHRILKLYNNFIKKLLVVMVLGLLISVKSFASNITSQLSKLEGLYKSEQQAYDEGCAAAGQESGC